MNYIIIHRYSDAFSDLFACNNFEGINISGSRKDCKQVLKAIVINL